jgi:3-oxoacyl-[acyl-carrier-protein] synthase II
MMNINGIGIICNYGRGIDSLKAVIDTGRAPEILASRVNYDILKDKIFSKDARRSDRFDRLAVLAALDALSDSGINSEVEKNNIGIILATAFGPHATTFRFLDDILNFKESDVSPILFSHSVHNAAVSYVSALSGIRGPTLTVTRFSRAFEEALILAQAWLEQKRARYVLVGAVDELSSIMEYITKPLAASVLGEGSVFFVVSQEKCAKIYLTAESLTGPCVAASEPFQSAFSCAAEIILKMHRRICAHGAE